MNFSENCGNVLSSSIDPDRYLYRGKSMMRLFAEGDIVVARPVAFEEVRRGDVLVFSRDGAQIVHRVRRKGAAFLEMIGDNNARCDIEKVGRGATLKKVVARIDRKKHVIAVSGGNRGMCRFFCNRFRRLIRRLLAKVMHGIWRIADWRKALPVPEKFGDDLCYFAGGRLIARRRAERKNVEFIRLTDHFKYRSR